jgi:4-amino-4-deoxy-L-arabinose transferase-like glycosyltransferase
MSRADATLLRAARWLLVGYRSPFFWILLAAGLLRLASLGWGLPGTTGWDDDGVAPRDFLFGVYKTYAPGSFYTYPPLHLILLTTLTTPVWVPVLLGAKSLAQPDMVAAFLQVPVMTLFAVVARLVSVAMSLGTIAIVGKMTELVGGRRAGLLAAAACALNAGLTYYGQVTNLDGPYLFWSSLSLWLWMRLIVEHDVRHIRWAMFFAGLAVATKDQAYAIFLLSIPATFALWLADPWPRRHVRELVATLSLWFVVTLALLLIVDGAIINPLGFERRMLLLIGPASQDYASYEAGLRGALALLGDAWRMAPNLLPEFAILLGLLGLVVSLLRVDGSVSIKVAAAVPFLAIVSFTLAFDLIALRMENRFLLPQTVFLSVYIGLFVDWIWLQERAWVRYAATVPVACVAFYALYLCIGVDNAFLHDPRYDAERWLATNVRPGQTIETYGDNVYLPRFPEGVSVTRVDEGLLVGRNPVFHATDLHQSYAALEERRPQFIVVSGRWVSDYLFDPSASAGRKVSNGRLAVLGDRPARDYFRRLFHDRLAYRLAHLSAYSSRWLPAPTIYESLAQEIYIFRRSPSGR